MGYDNFKSKVCLYYNSIDDRNDKGPLFKITLDKIVENELPRRDSECFFLVRDFAKSSDININLTYENIICRYSSEDKILMTGIVGPSWNRGWTHISKDKFVSDNISYLFHFISQYIYRSYQINLIGAIVLATQVPTDFRGDKLNYTYGEHAKENIRKFKGSVKENASELERKILGYLKLINALDPSVNKAIFYYIRALELKKFEFTEESLTAADNMVDVIIQEMKKRLKIPTQDRKLMSEFVYKELRFFDQTDKYNLERVYLLRCRFTAHPSHSKWWDFYEIYENSIEEIMYSVRKFLISFLKYENINRQIESKPDLWSSWFKEHCETIYDAVWFHHLP